MANGIKSNRGHLRISREKKKLSTRERRSAGRSLAMGVIDRRRRSNNSDHNNNGHATMNNNDTISINKNKKQQLTYGQVLALAVENQRRIESRIQDKKNVFLCNRRIPQWFKSLQKIQFFYTYFSNIFHSFIWKHLIHNTYITPWSDSVINQVLGNLTGSVHILLLFFFFYNL